MMQRHEIDAALGYPLSDDQWAATCADLAPGVIVAGAGSGKTSVMAARVLWAVRSGLVTADQVLGLTFTNKAAGELLSRVRTYLAQAAGEALGDPVIATYHSFSSSLITDNAIRIGLEPDARVLSAGARAQLAARVVRQADPSIGRFGRALTTWVGNLLDLDDALADSGVSASELAAWDDAFIAELLGHAAAKKPQKIAREMRQTAEIRRALVDLVVEFRELKASRHCIDFADQTRLALDLARRFGDVRAVNRDRYRLVLLDEYQDTSTAQRLLLQELFGDSHPVTAVGDPFQSIYGFRGATVANIDNFPVHFPSGDVPASVHNLLENRRSGPAILEVANHVTADLRAVHPTVKPLVAAAPESKGPGELTAALFDTIADEVAWIVERVRSLHARDDSWRDIAVLVRNRDSAHRVDRALRAAGVPTQVEGASRLLETPEIIELTSILEVLADPTANVAMMRLLAGPRWALGIRDLAAIGRYGKQLIGRFGREDDPDVHHALVSAVQSSDESECVSLLEAIDGADSIPGLSSEAAERIGRLADELRMLRQHLDEPLVDIINRVLATTGLGIELAVGDDPTCDARIAVLDEFLSIAAQFTDPDGASSLIGFLALLRASETYDASMGDAPGGDAVDAVRIMTMHKAKGLEFRHVIVPFMAPGVFPSSQAPDRWPTVPSVIPWRLRADAPEVLATFPPAGGEPRGVDHDAFKDASKIIEAQEELRLAYVALTRAEISLAVSSHWWGPTQTRPRGPNEVLATFRTFAAINDGTIHTWRAAPEKDATNPLLDDEMRARFPSVGDVAARAARLSARDAVLARIDATSAAVEAVEAAPHAQELTDAEAATVAQWDRDLPALLDRARMSTQASRTVRLPAGLSASDLIRLARDPQGFAFDLARPMPGRPTRAADRGTRFHAWVESRFGQQPLLLPDDLPGAADEELSEADLEVFKANFEASVYARREPIAIERPFALVLAGRVIRGRIDAVFANGDRVEVVDWKTGRKDGTDALQLSIYRLAWAELTGTPIDMIDATFFYAATGQVSQETLMSRAQVEAILLGQ